MKTHAWGLRLLGGLLALAALTPASAYRYDESRYSYCRVQAERISGYYGPVPDRYLDGGAGRGAARGAVAGVAIGGTRSDGASRAGPLADDGLVRGADVAVAPALVANLPTVSMAVANEAMAAKLLAWTTAISNRQRICVLWRMRAKAQSKICIVAKIRTVPMRSAQSRPADT